MELGMKISTMDKYKNGRYKNIILGMYLKS